jgi:Rieske Fe-S protein
MATMNVTRRQALALIGTTAICGCGNSGNISQESFPTGPVDAGLVEGFSVDGAYGGFRDTHGFFVVRERGRLYAQSAICTHRRCKVAAAGSGFQCDCHGSTFTVEGKVTKGPASRDLPRFAVEKDEQGHLIVHAGRVLAPEQLDAPGGFVAV